MFLCFLCFAAQYQPHDEGGDDDNDGAEGVGHHVEPDPAHVHVGGAVAAAVGVAVATGLLFLDFGLHPRIHDLKVQITSGKAHKL